MTKKKLEQYIKLKPCLKYPSTQLAQPPAPAFASHKVCVSPTRTFIVDSGASVNLISYSSLQPAEKRKIKPVKKQVSLRAAGGIITPTEQVSTYVPDLKCTVECLLYEGAPTLLSLGQLVQNCGFTYTWGEQGPAFLTHKKGWSVECDIVHSVPHDYANMGVSEKEEKAEKESPEHQGPSGQSEQAPAEVPEQAKGDAGGNSCSGDATQQNKVDKKGQQSKNKIKKTLDAEVDEVVPPPEGKTTEIIKELLNKLSKSQRRKQRKKMYPAPQSAHNQFTHFPMDPDCEICKQAKIQREPCRSRPHGPPDHLPEPKTFADALTADHEII